MEKSTTVIFRDGHPEHWPVGIGNAKKKRKRRRIFERDGWRCLECGEDDPANLTIDHVRPRCRGGSDEDANLQTLCHPCNQAKADRYP